MSIYKVLDVKTGTYLFNVRARGVVNGQSYDLKAQGLKTEALAELSEKKLHKQGQEKAQKKKSRANFWSTIIGEWEMAAKKGDIFIRQLAPTTVEDYMVMLKHHTQEWYLLPIEEIDRAKAWRVLDKVETETSVSRRKRLRVAIDAVYRWAMLSGRVTNLQVIPTEGFRGTKREEEKMPEILNLEQIRTLLKFAKEINHQWYPHWAMALYTGMRSGELYALQWTEIDFDNKLLYVHRNWTSRGGWGPTKGRYWRSVPIESEQILELLKEQKRLRPDDKFVLERFQHWTDGEQAAILREFCVGAGIPSIRFHTLRACFATQLIRDAIAPAVVMKICGWRDLKTMQRYIRLAGIEIKGATKGLKLLPEREVMGRVIELFQA